MRSFKNGFRVYTTSNGINDALIIDLSSETAPKIVPKSLPYCFQQASEGGMDDDSDLKLEKGGAESNRRHLGTLKLEGFWPSGGRETGKGHATLSSHAVNP